MIAALPVACFEAVPISTVSRASPVLIEMDALKGDRIGQFSIRINDQWRICFAWPDGTPGPVEVEIVDYH